MVDTACIFTGAQKTEMPRMHRFAKIFKPFLMRDK